MQKGKGKIWVLIGTRPEVIKQIPLYWELRKRFGERVELVSSGQHRELLQQALDHFGEKAESDLATMTEQASLTQSAAKILERVGEKIAREKPEWIVVQGDTTTAAMAAWAAFLHGVKVLHNEAGLRSFDLANPFPEEANRKLISMVASVNAAPTERAQRMLENEGVKNIRVTGNTGIDALLWTLEHTQSKTAFPGENYVLVTAHRRENKEEFAGYFQALADFVATKPEWQFIVPVHPNHLAKDTMEAALSRFPQVKFIATLDYGSTCHLLSRCRLVVTDSGGIQEEAASLGIPVVVFRKTTERMEAVNANLAKLTWPAASGGESIASALSWAAQKSTGGLKNKILFPLFGDGHAAARIASLLD